MTTNTENRLWQAYFELLPEYVDAREHRRNVVRRSALALAASTVLAAGLFLILR